MGDGTQEFCRILKAVDPAVSNTGLFSFPHPAFADSVNRAIVQSEVEGGVYLRDLPQGAEIEVETENRFYLIVYLGDSEATISGHPVYCPEPVPVRINGSTWGGSMIKSNFIGRGMHLEFRHPDYHVIVTSRIVEIREHRGGRRPPVSSKTPRPDSH